MNHASKETKVVETENRTQVAADVLAQYNEQTGDDNVHFYHIDGYTYSDYSDSCCC